MSKKPHHLDLEAALSKELNIDLRITNRHEETNPSKTRRAVEDLLEIRRYKAMHDDYDY